MKSGFVATTPDTIQTRHSFVIESKLQVMFALMIITRILFVACMVFIIGYVFGPFSRRPALRTITKVATILVIMLFFSSRIFFVRFGGPYNGWRQCDSTHSVETQPRGPMR